VFLTTYIKLKKTKLIVFDIDGTLTDSVKIHQKAFTEMLFKIGVKEINTAFKSFKHHTDSFIAKEIYESDTQETISSSKLIEFEKGLNDKITKQKINEIKGAKQLLNHLENNSEYGICFATGSLLRPAIHKLKSIGISYHKSQLVASDHIYERETIVSMAIQQAKTFYDVNEFSQIISVGDGLWDLLTAKNLKIDFIGVGNQNKKVLKDNGTKVILKDLTEFKLK
jgi:phosphoglycolate phosphatase-like HAD superfamily hydrolase